MNAKMRFLHRLALAFLLLCFMGACGAFVFVRFLVQS